MKRRFFLSLLILPSSAWAHSFKMGDIAIGHAWGLPSEGPETSVMMPLLNTGSTPDALISASSPLATTIELREGNSIVAEFALDPNHPFPMRAVAKHLQVIGLAKTLAAGDSLPLVLNFKLAGQIKIEVHISDKAGD